MKELMANIQEAVEACLSVDLGMVDMTGNAQVLEIAV